MVLYDPDILLIVFVFGFFLCIVSALCSHLPSTFDGWVPTVDFYLLGFSSKLTHLIVKFFFMSTSSRIMDGFWKEGEKKNSRADDFVGPLVPRVPGKNWL